ncbi:MAG: Omp28-related outer membrane protein [Tannerella sp.]|jgi:hypothetical protein|nr:Omp28-related outer membrane protein [Tannerella sp.]
MKRIEKGILFLSCLLSVVCVLNCSGNTDAPEPPVREVVVKISADTTVIKANGVDAVSFAVTADDEKVVSDVFIIRKGASNETDTLKGSNFSTKEAGKYTFYASYKGKTSNEISIDAAVIVVLLQADKNTIKANDKDAVQFTITVDGQDVTSAAAITREGEPDVVLDQVSFATKNPSTYKFYATYEGIKSNEVSIEATEIEYLLTVDKSSVKADGSEEAVFQVILDGADITSAATIYQRMDDVETVLDAPVFFTDNYGMYTFYAVYDGEKTKEIEVNATYVNIQFVMHHLIMEFTSTTCPNCVHVEPIIREVQNLMTDRLHRLALHMGGKHCFSSLEGVMGQVANSLSSDSLFPSMTINLRYDEGLKPTQTPTRISQALEKSERDRSRVSETGIAVESKVNGTDIDFTVKVKSIKTDNYGFFAFIVEDGVVHSQLYPDPSAEAGYSTVLNYVNNDVVTYSLSGDPLRGISLGQVARGRETIRKYTIRTSEHNAKRTVNLSKCRIVGYTVRPNGVIDNVVNCPVNGSVLYPYVREVL